MSLTVTITGTEQLRAALARIGADARPQIAQALYQEAEAIMADSKENFVPVDLAILRASGHVQLPTIEGDNVTVAMGYGGAAKDYAVIQHERLDFKHPVGGAKYLERPLLKAASGLAARLADRIRGTFR
jgi:hypothetical protein